jgi:hypothetical protein
MEKWKKKGRPERDRRPGRPFASLRSSFVRLEPRHHLAGVMFSTRQTQSPSSMSTFA